MPLTASIVTRAKNEARFIGETLAAIFAPTALWPARVVVGKWPAGVGVAGPRTSARRSIRSPGSCV